MKPERLLLIRNYSSDEYFDCDDTITALPLSKDIVLSIFRMYTRALLAYAWEDIGERPFRISYLMHWHSVLERSCVEPRWNDLLLCAQEHNWVATYIRPEKLSSVSGEYCIPTASSDICETIIYLDGTVVFSSGLKHTNVTLSTVAIPIDDLCEYAGIPRAQVEVLTDLSRAKLHPKTSFAAHPLRIR